MKIWIKMLEIFPVNVILVLLCCKDIICDQNIDERISWREWWSYEGPSGPIRWGSLDTNWYLCTKGMYQSPINILPQKLLFDPNLMRLNLDIRHKIPGNLVNTGHDLTFLFDEVMIGMFNISDGPLMYNYKVNEIKVHYGKHDDQGSEHMVDGATFAAEIQFIGYNLDIYKTINEARKQPFGTAIIAVLAEIGKPDSSAFQTLIGYGSRIKYKGQIRNFCYSNQDKYLTCVNLTVARMQMLTLAVTNTKHDKLLPGQIRSSAILTLFLKDIVPDIPTALVRFAYEGAKRLLIAVPDGCRYVLPLGKIITTKYNLQTCRNVSSGLLVSGESIRLDGFNIRDLLPKTNYYVTYEGSFTQPGCQETVTWIILNKPIYITKSNLRTLRRLYRSTSNHEALRLDNSRRPVMPLNNRVVKTNINYPSRSSLCSMNRDTFYQMNPSLEL